MIETPTDPIAWLIILPVILPLLAGGLCVMFRRYLAMQAHIGIGTTLLLVIINGALLAKVLAGGPFAMTMGNWLPPFGISFAADALGVLLTLTTALVGLAIAIYALDDVDARARRFGFFPLLLTLLAGVNGAFLTGDVFNLYVWLEVLLLCSFGLMVLGGERIQLDGAVKYAFLNLIATTFYLVAVGLLYGATGTLNFADLARVVPGHEAAGLLAVIALLFLVSLGMKAAAFPLFFWLPAAYHTPKFVVSALFAGLLTKVGIYAIYRVFTIVFLDAPSLVYDVMFAVAILTMVLGAVGAIAQSALRRMLGYLVISGIGAMLAGIALRSPDALAGGIFYFVHSMLVMTALYLVAGAVTRLAGSEDYGRSGGLYEASPLLAGLFLALGLAAAGLPPFSGFWPKFILVRESIALSANWTAVAILLSGFLSVIAIAKSWVSVFLRGGPAGTPDGAAAPFAADAKRTLPAATIMPIAALLVLVGLIGFVPTVLMLVALPAAFSLLDPQAYIAAVFGGS